MVQTCGLNRFESSILVQTINTGSNHQCWFKQLMVQTGSNHQRVLVGTNSKPEMV
jgi:GH24 family phage-related lysozyme (muramidase)